MCMEYCGVAMRYCDIVTMNYCCMYDVRCMLYGVMCGVLSTVGVPSIVYEVLWSKYEVL